MVRIYFGKLDIDDVAKGFCCVGRNTNGGYEKALLVPRIAQRSRVGG